MDYSYNNMHWNIKYDLAVCSICFHFSFYSSFLSVYIIPVQLPYIYAINKITRHTLLIRLYQESEYFKTLTREFFKQSLVNLSSKETEVIWLYVHYFKICVCFSLLPNHHAIQPGARDMDTD